MLTLHRSMAVWAIAIGCMFAGMLPASAAPYAALVMDARNGKVLHARSADRRLHPASLTKMMTLFLTFEAVGQGRLKLDQKVRISRRAAAQVPSKIGFRVGQRVTIRDLIRATAVKSANDAAVALAEAIEGSEADFARKMTRRAKEIGMKNTQFRNASGLTAKGQYSSARDMAILGRALFYDFPQYYNLFGRKRTKAMGRMLHSTNRKLLSAYRGADGIKTGYTNAAGFNLVSSAQRGQERIIAVVFGGRTSASRNARIAELLDMGFDRAPTRVAVVKPRTSPRRATGSVLVRVSPSPVPKPGASAVAPSLLAQAGAVLLPSAAQASERVEVASAWAPQLSPRPVSRPGTTQSASAGPSPRPVVVEQSASLVPRSGWSVQLGVFRDKETAIAELASAALSDVTGMDYAGREISELTLSGNQAYRARLTGFDQRSAQSVCNSLKSRGQSCLPVAANSP